MSDGLDGLRHLLRLGAGVEPRRRGPDGQPLPRKRRIRDPQRGRFYKAENHAFPESRDGGMSYEETVGYVTKVWRSAWTQKRFKRARTFKPPEVADGRGTRWARGSLTRLNLPKWARTTPVILHEVCHALHHDEAAHGWAFAQRYLALVQHFLGRQDAQRLKASYRQHKVRYKKPRTMSPETLAKLRARGHQLVAAKRAQQAPEAPTARDYYYDPTEMRMKRLPPHING